MPKPFVVLSAGKSHGLQYAECFFKAEADKRPDKALLTDGNPSSNDKAVNENDPSAFYGCGHGNTGVFTVECTQRYIDTACLRCDMWKDRYVHLLSCYTAVSLGPHLINRGAKSYTGYRVAFVYGVYRSGSPWPPPCTPPDDNRDFYTFIDSDTEHLRGILAGKTVGEANKMAIDKFNEYIKKYTEGEWKNRPIAPYAARYLQQDRDGLTMLGDPNFKPIPTITLPIPAPSALLLSLGLVLAGVIYPAARRKKS